MKSKQSCVGYIKMVNIFIVYAHHLQYKSFNAALREFAVKVLTEQGHKVVVTDLYAQNFKSLLKVQKLRD